MKLWFCIVGGIALGSFSCTSGALTQRALWITPVPGVKISGVVLDEVSDNPVPNAEVLIGGTMLHARTNQSGEFLITNVPAGVLDAVVILPNSREHTTRLEIENRADQFLQIIVPRNVHPQPPANYDPEKIIAELRSENAELRRKLGIDRLNEKKGSDAEIALFEKYLIGDPKQCILLNPDALSATVENRNEGRGVTYSASQPVLVENWRLGYKLQVFLKHAQVWETKGGFNIDYRAAIVFSDLLPKNPRDTKQWQNNRRKVYSGSLRHFLASLVAGRLADEGFMVATTPDGDGQVGSPGVPGYNSSSAQRFVPRQNPYFIVATADHPAEHQLNFNNVIEVTYLKDFVDSKYRHFRGIVDDRQVSLISLTTKPATVNANGILADNNSMQMAGYWAIQQVCDLLPITYIP